MIYFLIFFSASFNKSWCEPTLYHFSPVEDADLIQVQVLTRHGARTPLHSINSSKIIFRCNNTEYRLYEYPESHPMKINVAYGKSIFGAECLFGQLLDKGRSSLKRLGSHLRKIYVDQMKFIPSDYTQNVIQFRTTSTHRTIHSSMALADGLYPDHPEIVIYVADKDFDPFRRSSLVCPKMKKMIDDMKESKEIKEKFKVNLTKFKKVADALGVKLSSSFDIAMSSRCSGTPMVAKINDRLLDEGVILKAKQQIHIFSNESIFHLVFSFGFSEILNTFIDRISGSSTTRFKHWSGHNGNIFGFLAYFGEDLDITPPYGSYIIMELWKARNGTHFVRFNYNGRILMAPRINKGANIPLEDLIAFAKKKMPDLQNECGFDLVKVRKASVSLLPEK